MSSSIKPGTESEAGYRQLLSGIFGSIILFIGFIIVQFQMGYDACTLALLLAAMSLFFTLIKKHKLLWLTGMGSLFLITASLTRQISLYSFLDLGWGDWVFSVAGVALLTYAASLSPFEKKMHNRIAQIMQGLVAALSVAIVGAIVVGAMKSPDMIPIPLPPPPPIENGILADGRDGKTYKTTKIGKQIWMAENLGYNANGSVCYDENPAYCERYGRLYDWKTADMVCPAGWHLPSDAEWEELEEHISNDSLAGRKLRAKSGWKNNGGGTDNYGFSALPGGLRNAEGSFYNIGVESSWWTANEDCGRSVGSWYENIYRYFKVKSVWNYVRCVKDGEERFMMTHEPPSIETTNIIEVTASISGEDGGYVKCGILLEYDPAHTLLGAVLEKDKARIKNIIIDIMSSKPRSYLTTDEGKKAIRKQIAAEINAVLPETAPDGKPLGKIRNSYFDSFLMQ